MVSKSCLEIFVCWLANCKAFCKSFSEMEGYIETTSKERNLSLSLFGSSLNQDMTESEFIHCLYLVLVLTSLIILERICLEMTCRSGLVGLMSLTLGSSWKCGLWSFKVTLAGLAWVAIILSSRSCWATISFWCSVALLRSSLAAFLYSLWMFLLRRSLNWSVLSL